MPKRVDAPWRKFEKFHDKHRYLIPLIFISVVLMTFGINYLGPVTIINHANLTGPITFRSDSNVLALTLLPGWSFRADIITTKPVTMELIDLSGNLINSTTNSILFSGINYLDYYFLRLKGSNFALLELNYYYSGKAPYALEYSLFGGGLLLLLLTLIYFFISPLKIKFKRIFKSRIDGFFYPMIVFLSIIVFWVFMNAFMWIIPKDIISIITHVIIALIIVLILSFISTKRQASKVNAFIINYALTYFLLYIVLLLAYGGLVIGFWIFLLKISILSCLILLYRKSKSRVAVNYFILVWIISTVLNIAVYVVGVPVNFDNALAVPSMQGTWLLFMLVEGFMIAALYFMIRGYYSSNLAVSLENGLYAGVLFQGLMQAVMVTNVMI